MSCAVKEKAMPTRRRKQTLLAPAMRLLDEGFGQQGPRDNGLGWIHEALAQDPAYMHRPMFGCDAAYLGGLLYVVTATKHEPWNGLLVCTTLDRQSALHAEWPALAPHGILRKWLYVSQDHPDFERAAKAVIRRALVRDERIGVAPTPKKRKHKSPKKLGI
jgi:hypothetical protein